MQTTIFVWCWFCHRNVVAIDAIAAVVIVVVVAVVVSSHNSKKN